MRDALGSVQTALVVGGGSDIGLATARQLVDSGAETVILAARRPEALEGRTDELRKAGATVHVVEFDADDTASHEAFIAAQGELVGDIDVVLLAFGVLGDGTVNTDPQEAARLLHTNFVGAASVLLAAANQLRNQGHGAIVVLSSVAGERVRKTNFVYGASKAGIDGLAQGLGDALAGSGVDVIVVRPGFVHSKMTRGLSPPPFSTTPEEVADAIADALRTRRRVVWVPSVLRLVMIVARHLPRSIFRRLKF